VAPNNNGTAVNPNDPLAQLRDIHLPPDISIWPLAPGWWLLILLAIASISYLAWRLIKRHRAKLYRRQALQKLQQLELTQPDNTVAAVFELLKQTANISYADQCVSSQTIDDFVDFLKESCPQPVFQDLPHDLSTMLYGKQSASSSSSQLTGQLISNAKTWITEHVAGDGQGANA
jgi:hypothetical protein